MIGTVEVKTVEVKRVGANEEPYENKALFYKSAWLSNLQVLYNVDTNPPPMNNVFSGQIIIIISFFPNRFLSWKFFAGEITAGRYLTSWPPREGEQPPKGPCTWGFLETNMINLIAFSTAIATAVPMALLRAVPTVIPMVITKAIRMILPMAVLKVIPTEIPMAITKEIPTVIQMAITKASPTVIQTDLPISNPKAKQKVVPTP